MQALIGFLSSDDTFLAEIPDEEYMGPSARSVVNLGWTKSSIVHLPPGVSPIGDDGSEPVRRVYAGDTPVDVYVRVDEDPDNDITVLSWLLPTGQLCTHLPSALGSEAIEGMGSLLNSMAVSVDDRGLPRVALKLPLTGGDPRISIEQDDVVFISARDDIPDVGFAMSGAFSRTSTVLDVEHVEVAIGLDLGVTVRCAGPAAIDYQLVEASATSIAASLTRIAAG